MDAEIEHHINSIMLEAANMEERSEQKPSFRCSALPFCPLLNLLADSRMNSYRMDFYTSIGTAVHELNQKWIPKTRFNDRVLGHWKCSACNKVHMGENGAPIKMPQDVCDCRSNSCTYTYEEITVNYRGLSGHVDMITEVAPGKYFLWDWKTTDLSGKKRRPGWKNLYPSSPNYVIQIRTYASLIREIWGINIIGWALIFVDRAKVINGKSDFHIVKAPWNAKRTAKHMQYIDQACDNNAMLEKLRTIIDNSNDFSEKADRLLRKIVLNRPCTDEDSYQRWMKKGFYGDNDCRFKDQCCKSSRASYNAILESLNPNDEVPW